MFGKKELTAQELREAGVAREALLRVLDDVFVITRRKFSELMQQRKTAGRLDLEEEYKERFSEINKDQNRIKAMRLEKIHYNYSKISRNLRKKYSEIHVKKRVPLEILFVMIALISLAYFQPGEQQTKIILIAGILAIIFVILIVIYFRMNNSKKQRKEPLEALNLAHQKA